MVIIHKMTDLLTPAQLIECLVSTVVSPKEKVLLALAYCGDGPTSVSKIRSTAISFGLREAKTMNISRFLINSKGLVARLPNGWQLTKTGITQVKSVLAKQKGDIAPETAINLRNHLAKISNSDTRVFIEEAIECLEANLLRSAVVMSWVGAISILYDYVISHRLSDFNAEAARRNAKWKTAITRDDLALMREAEFLDILAELSILGKNTKEHLKNSELNLRNSCGHPSSLLIGVNNVEAHIEFLLLNVYQKF
jgi:hypothetical protein